jgi:hypothetical protein
MSQLVGLAECAEHLGFASRGRRPGNRLWELLRAGKLRGLPYLRLGRTYRFDLSVVDDWVKRQAANGANGTTRLRYGLCPTRPDRSALLLTPLLVGRSSDSPRRRAAIPAASRLAVFGRADIPRLVGGDKFILDSAHHLAEAPLESGPGSAESGTVPPWVSHSNLRLGACRPIREWTAPAARRGTASDGGRWRGASDCARDTVSCGSLAPNVFG